jgi:uncharacterized protein (DUF885 family)
MGFYTDDIMKFGNLGDEMLRACRLVIDTGIHSLGWDRQQSIDYLKENTPLSDLDIKSEVDRYIAWPGQVFFILIFKACSYKIGAIKISELKTKAMAVLKEKFNIRDFHDIVLKQGALPLNILDSIVNTNYINKVSE